jgi:multidrug resistance efflux pump
MIPIVFLVVLIIAGVVYLGSISGPEEGPLTASGTIASVEVAVAAEVSGRVSEVMVQESDVVEAGQPLFQLDDALLVAQRDRAASALETAAAAARTAEAARATAELQYEIALQSARLQAAPARQLEWQQPLPWQVQLPAWYFSASEELAAAEHEAAAAQAALDTALDELRSDLERVGLADEEERVAQAQAAFAVAQSVLDQATAANEPEAVLDEAEALRDAAQDELEVANDAYDEALDLEMSDEHLNARAAVAVARARLDAARERLAALRVGDESLQVRASSAALDQARAASEQATVALAQARAELALADVQLARLTVLAPISGVVVTRSVEPGEVVVAGGAVMTLGDLNHLTITTYITESRYGEIALGDRATVTVDSFPGEAFEAEVVRIADQAEFTPRNVQTEEGRRTTVFAVELSLPDTGGRLKPGMPADVTFGSE